MAEPVLLECRAGRALSTLPGSSPSATGLAWHLTTVGRALPKAGVLALKASGGFPEAADLILVRFAPEPDWRLTLRTLYSSRAAEATEVAIQEDAARLGEERALAGAFLFVHGPEPLPDGFGFPCVRVVDVTEENALGHAPKVEFQTPAAGPVPVILGELPTDPPREEPPREEPPREEPDPVDPPPDEPDEPDAPGGKRVYRGVLRGAYFEVDKCFVLPSALPALRRLRQRYVELAGAGFDVLVVGHTDSTGADDYNLGLSVERAGSLAALLRDDGPHWEAWYGADRLPSKRWGTREDQHMLSVLPDGEAGPTAFYKGPITGVADAATSQAIKDFQAHSNATRGTSLTEDGFAGPATRKELVDSYMDIDGATLPATATLLTHGCGEFHPAVEAGDGAAVDENRRAEVFLFERPEGVQPPPRPCTAPGCGEYPQWVAAVQEPIELES